MRGKKTKQKKKTLTLRGGCFPPPVCAQRAPGKVRTIQAGPLKLGVFPAAEAIATYRRCEKAWKSPRASLKRFRFQGRLLKALLLPTVPLPCAWSHQQGCCWGSPCMEEQPHPSPIAVPRVRHSILDSQQEKETKTKGMKKVQVSNMTTTALCSHSQRLQLQFKINSNVCCSSNDHNNVIR